MKPDHSTGSATAVGAAMLRVAHQLLDGGDKLLDDPIILKLIQPEWKADLLENRYHYFKPEAMALRTHIVLRSRYAEDRLARAVQGGVEQFVIIGAGLDTFAYRQPEWAKSLQITELDHPASQREKLDCLKHAGIQIPSNVSHVPIDLEKDDIRTALVRGGINLKEPIFMSCLGVLVYLSKKSIDQLFEFAGSLATGSEFVFTISQQKDEEKLNLTAERAALLGEPWISHFNLESLHQQLLDLGFSNVTFLTPEAIIAQYYAGSKVQLPPPRRSSLVSATIE